MSGEHIFIEWEKESLSFQGHYLVVLQNLSKFTNKYWILLIYIIERLNFQLWLHENI
jgi:hypothetical protein